MSRRPAPARRALLLAGMLAAVVLLPATACTREQADPDAPVAAAGRGLDSVDGRVAGLRLLHVYVASPGERGTTHVVGEGAELFLTVAGDGEAADALVGASSEAGQVLFRDGDADPLPRFRIEVPAEGVASLRLPTGPHLELADLVEPLRSGTSLAITFEFELAGSVTLSVPVAVYEVGGPPTLPAEPT
ncbi:copper chaperone PCu(A)C [Trujillonella endophytica]|uniref:Copper(I)-binding protein n=1 Tax=Trujillonella endophytica TaxID=673521 RepID=A0A1H8R6K3_9ACTN|nr:copper chaperone PCu(A)C [Trujillella endophytica]SEO62012.1 Copper(I)-binding protein [Trujillella endophytica]